MATLADIGVSALVNITGAIVFLLAFALLRIQPLNDRVYFPKWYINGRRKAAVSGNGFVTKFVNLNFRTYLTFLNWMPQALKMTENELIDHAGLDSAVFLRIYTLGLKIFLPITALAILVLVPVNFSEGTLFFLKRDLVTSEIDKLSISNVAPKSYKFFIHIAAEYLFTLWTCFMLFKEYGKVASMRLQFLASQPRRSEQFTVLVRNIPRASRRSVSDSVEQFFKKNHPYTYLCHQKGFLGFCGEKVDAIRLYEQRLENMDRKMTMERQRILKKKNHTMHVAFVSFNSRWGAAVCAQTEQSKNPTMWLTSWAPEPRDVYWHNLAIPFVSLTIRKLIIGISVFALVFFYMIPIAFVQSLANLEGIEKVSPFLRPVINMKFIKSFLEGFMPGLALKIFFIVLPSILMFMSKIEGYVAKSQLERRAASKYYYFMLVNNMFLVKTERDREKAMYPGSVDYPETLPCLQLYFLLGLVYAAIINVYDQKYESAAAFWPHVHSRIIASLLISQLVLLGLLSTKKAANSTPLLIVLPILTLAFHRYCKNRFQPAFSRYPLEEAIDKDTEEHSLEPNLNLESCLADAYLHPIIRSFEEVELEANVRIDACHVGEQETRDLTSGPREIV
ncbi:hypothetical protein V2J09_004800 [Rumex salicifolius]